MCKKRVNIIQALLTDIRKLNANNDEVENGNAIADVHNDIGDDVDNNNVADNNDWDAIINQLNAEFAQRLREAITTPRVGQVKAFENFINTVDSPDVTNDARENARELLRQAWALYQEADFMIESIEDKPRDVADKILTAFFNTALHTFGTTRQPWFAASKAAYISDPQYFKQMLQGGIEFLESKFKKMPLDHKINMLNSIQGWNHQKGPMALSIDLPKTDYSTPPKKTKKTLLRKQLYFYLNLETDTGFPYKKNTTEIENFPDIGTLITDGTDVWKITNITNTHFTIIIQEHENYKKD